MSLPVIVLALLTGIISNAILKKKLRDRKDAMFFSILLTIFFPVAWLIGIVHYGGEIVEQYIGDEQ